MIGHLRRNWLRWIGGLLALVVIGIGLAPSIIIRTSMKDRIVERSAAKRRATAHIETVQWGWFTPLDCQDVTFASLDQILHIKADGLKSDRTVLDRYLDERDWGHVVIDRPRVEVRIPRPWDAPADQLKDSDSETVVNAELNDVEIEIFDGDDEEPVLKLEQANLTARVQREHDQRVLTLEPVKLLDHEEITEEMCDEGLQLVAPVLSDATRVKGSISLDLERARFPLGKLSTSARLRAVELQGSIQLHNVTARARNPIITSVAKLLAAAAEFKMPDEIQVVNESKVRFHVHDGRVHHEGLAFVLPQVAGKVVVYSSGSVGIDETVDLQIQVAVSNPSLKNIPVVAELTEKPLQLTVKGTVQTPEVMLPEGRDVLDELADRLSPKDNTGRKPSMAGSIGDLIDAVSSEEPSSQENILKGSGAVLNIIRTARENERKRKEAEEAQKQGEKKEDDQSTPESE